MKTSLGHALPRNLVGPGALRRRRSSRLLLFVLAPALVVGLVQGESLVPAGKPALDLSLPSLAGENVRLGDLKGRVVLLLFGELYNENSIAAAKDVAEVMARPALAGVPVSALMVITQEGPAESLRTEAQSKGIRFAVLQDKDRRVFASYHVVVLPSLVVLDAKGAVVLSCAGYPLDFKDMLADAVLFSGGKLSGAEFGRRRSPATMPAASEEQKRALRLAALGDQLAARGFDELAVANFQEALSLAPDCVPARLSLGRHLLRRRELVEAEKQFRHILDANPGSVEASLGIIHIELIRGGGELASAGRRLGELLHKHPNDPEAVYLAGLVAEKSGDANAALGHYKKAAELLLGRQQSWELK